jgi:hypothetical protein
MEHIFTYENVYMIFVVAMMVATLGFSTYFVWRAVKEITARKNK